jgi:hypothetical protein
MLIIGNILPANQLKNPSHGDAALCPTCLCTGFIDIDTPVGCKVEQGAIWVENKEADFWVCTECDLK